MRYLFLRILAEFTKINPSNFPTVTICKNSLRNIYYNPVLVDKNFLSFAKISIAIFQMTMICKNEYRSKMFLEQQKKLFPHFFNTNKVARSFLSCLFCIKHGILFFLIRLNELRLCFQWCLFYIWWTFWSCSVKYLA